MFAKLKKLITISRSLFIYNDPERNRFRPASRVSKKGPPRRKPPPARYASPVARQFRASGRIYIPAASQRADAVIPTSGQEYLKTKTSVQPPHGRLYGHLQLSQIAEKGGFEPILAIAYLLMLTAFQYFKQ